MFVVYVVFYVLRISGLDTSFPTLVLKIAVTLPVASKLTIIKKKKS